MYIGASNDLEAQAYAPIILSPPVVTDTVLPRSFNSSCDGIREISANLMGLKSLHRRSHVCVVKI